MKKAYDRELVQRLLPLLRSIGVEIAERMHEERVLQGRIAVYERRGEYCAELFNLRAALAVHRRELRLARKELETLGCVLDRNHPGRILIPGADGDVENGFTWAASDPTLRRAATGVAIA